MSSRRGLLFLEYVPLYIELYNNINTGVIQNVVSTEWEP
jgi:hypothetical protein